MAGSNVKLVCTEGRWQILIDGVDVAAKVTRLELVADGDNMFQPEVTIRLAPGAEVEIDGATVSVELKGEQDD